MTATLETEIAKLNDEQKLELIERLRMELEHSGPPVGILSEDDPRLEAELEKRLNSALTNPEQWLTLEQFKAAAGDK